MYSRGLYSEERKSALEQRVDFCYPAEIRFRKRKYIKEVKNE